MIDKIVIDPEVEVTTNTLAKKFNELVDVLKSSPVRQSIPPQLPGPAQYIGYLEMMTQRLLTGPYKTLSETEPNALTEAIGKALDQLQVAIASYKKSLIGASETKATLEV